MNSSRSRRPACTTRRSNGIDRLVVRGQVITAQRLRLDRATRQARQPLRVRAAGLEPCLPWFGLDPVAAAAGPGRP